MVKEIKFEIDTEKKFSVKLLDTEVNLTEIFEIMTYLTGVVKKVSEENEELNFDEFLSEVKRVAGVLTDLPIEIENKSEESEKTEDSETEEKSGE